MEEIKDENILWKWPNGRIETDGKRVLRPAAKGIGECRLRSIRGSCYQGGVSPDDEEVLWPSLHDGDQRTPMPLVVCDTLDRRIERISA